jgi:hypothetical protein
VQISEFFLPAKKKKEVKLKQMREKFLQELQMSREQTKKIAGDKPPNPFLLPNTTYLKAAHLQKASASCTISYSFLFSPLQRNI